MFFVSGVQGVSAITQGCKKFMLFSFFTQPTFERLSTARWGIGNKLQNTGHDI